MTYPKGLGRVPDDVFGTDILLRPYAASASARREPPSRWSWRPHDPKTLARRRARRFAETALTNYRPAKRRQRIVLIIANEEEVPLALIDHLQASGLRYFCVHYDRFVTRGAVRIAIDRGGADVWLEADGKRLHLSDVAGVYYQEPVVVPFRPERDVPVAEMLFFSRWRKLVADLAALVPEDALWLPGKPPHPSQHVQQKVSEYAIAARCGLAVPETLCTNDYREAVAFHRRHGGRVIFRECSTPLGLRIGFFTPTAKARRLLPRTPCVFQRYIPKQYEIRAVAVGPQIVAASIDSQASEAAKLDWRVMDHARVAWHPTTLPRRVQGALRRFMRAVDLAVASFDIVKSTDGEYYFLEANRPGSFLWLTPLVGIDVPREIVGVLSAHIRNP